MPVPHSHLSHFKEALSQFPLIAILRGLAPQQALGVGKALTDHRFQILEIPLNSPEPLQSIALLRAHFPTAIVGAGTVLNVAQVRAVHAAGGQVVVSPNFNADVVSETRRLGMVSLPGVLTPSEAFTALDCGATALKLFPAEAVSAAVVKAMLAVLPGGTLLLPVGGIHPHSLAPWWAAGARGFGIGSNLFKPGKSAADVAASAQVFAGAFALLPGLPWV